MKNVNIQIGNESTQQFKHLKDTLLALPLNNNSQILLNQTLQKLQISAQSIDHIKLQLILTLQLILIDPSNLVPELASTSLQIENTLLNFFDQLEGRLPLNEEVLNTKVVITLIDFKLQLSNKQEPKLSVEEILPYFDQINLWQKYDKMRHTFIRYFYLCLLYQYLSDQHLGDQTLSVIVELISHILKCIRHQEENKMKVQQELLVMLLHMQLSFKCLKKNIESTVVLGQENQIYTVLYDLDQKISEDITYNYKRYISKGKSKCVQYVKEQLMMLIILYDEKNVKEELRADRQQNARNKVVNGLNGKRKSISLQQRKSISLQPRKSISVNKVKLLQYGEKDKQSSLKNLYQPTLKSIQAEPKQVKIRNNMFVSRTVNNNLKLERKLEIKKERVRSGTSKGSFQSFKSSNIGSYTTSKEIAKAKRKAFEALSYQSCKKASLNKNDELQMMLCSRPDSLKNQSNLLTYNRSSQTAQGQRKRKRVQKKHTVHFSPSSTVFKEESRDTVKEESECQIRFPQSIQKTMEKYILSLNQFLTYEEIKQRLPLNLFFRRIKMNQQYYYHGNILKFINVERINLLYVVSFYVNDKTYKIVKFQFDEEVNNILKFFVFGQKECCLSGFYFLGKSLQYYTLQPKASVEVKNQPFKIESIKDSQNIYEHIIQTNIQKLFVHHLKQLLKAQENHIQELNDELNIQFNYELPPSPQAPPEQKIYEPIKYFNYFKDHSSKKGKQLQFLTVFEYTKSMKHKTKMIVSHARIIERIQPKQIYLLLRSKIQYFDSLSVLPLRPSTIRQILLLIKNESNWQSLQKKLSSSRYLLQETWDQVLLNKNLLSFPEKKYVSNRSNGGYSIITNKMILGDELALISGRHNQRRWFFLINFQELEPKLSDNHLLKFNRRDGRNKTGARTTRKQFTKKMLPAYRLEMLQLWRTEQIRNVEVVEEQKAGGYAQLDRQEYKIVKYDYSWTIVTRDKLHLCYLLTNSTVFTIKILRDKFIYYGCYRGNFKRDKDGIYEEFRRKVIEKINIRTIVVREWNMIVDVRVEDDSVICSVDNAEVKGEVVIHPRELVHFQPEKLPVKKNFLSVAALRKRITSVFKQKFTEHLDEHIY